jgi:Na+/alanine symporter
MVIESLICIVVAILIFLWAYHKIMSNRAGYDNFYDYLELKPKWKWLMIVDSLLAAIVFIGSLVAVIFIIQKVINY